MNKIIQKQYKFLKQERNLNYSNKNILNVS